MPGDVRLGCTCGVDDLADGELTPLELLEDAEPNRVSENSKALRHQGQGPLVQRLFRLPGQGSVLLSRLILAHAYMSDQ